MPQKKKFNKKKALKFLELFIKSAIKPIIKACKVNNSLLIFANKYPYIFNEK